MGEACRLSFGMKTHEAHLSEEHLGRILTRLGAARRPEPTLVDLRTLYAAWCRHVPFDNVRKLIHARSGNPGPFPGSTAEDFFTAWLQHGTGGTCWAGAGALHALLQSLGFAAERGIATMLAAPELPPNHGTVRVTFGKEHYLVDSAILHVEPLRLEENVETAVVHPARGVRCTWRGGKAYIAWRPLHKVDGFECRLEHFGATAEDFAQRYEQTRVWSPFNYELSVRRNLGEAVVGAGFGQGVSLLADGKVSQQPFTQEQRRRLLCEDIGLSAEIVRQLPADVATPPPPGSKTAATAPLVAV